MFLNNNKTKYSIFTGHNWKYKLGQIEVKCKVKATASLRERWVGGWREAWAVDDGGGEDDGDGDDDDDDDLVSELATGLPGNQESGNIYYRSHIIQYMLILSPSSR